MADRVIAYLDGGELGIIYHAECVRAARRGYFEIGAFGYRDAVAVADDICALSGIQRPTSFILRFLADGGKLLEVHRVAVGRAVRDVGYLCAVCPAERDGGLVVAVVCNGAVGERVKRTLNGTVSIVSDFKGCFQRSVA